MKDRFFYEFGCIEDGEWISEKVTFEDRLVQDLRRSWNHRHNLERRYIRQHLFGDAGAIWRFNRQRREGRKRLIRELRAYRSNREFAPDLHQSLESWYLQNGKKHANFAFLIKWSLITPWAEDPDVFRNAKDWMRKLQEGSEKLWRT